MFYLIMGILVTATAVLVYQHDAGEVFGYPIEMVASVTVLSTWLLYLLSGRFGARTSLGTSLKQVAIWLLIGFGLVLGYSFKDDARSLVNRVAGEIVPGMGVPASDGGVTFRRLDNGHFHVNAHVNGEQISMLVDSGASSVVLSFEDARKIGIEVDALSFRQPVNTANGRTFAARVRLPSLSVGGIEVHRVQAMVSQPGDLNESLLGMSFLNKLGGWSVSGDRLTLKP